MLTVLAILPDGFEEIEATAPIDLDFGLLLVEKLVSSDQARAVAQAVCA